jgi:acyl-CoA thioesterase-1
LLCVLPVIGCRQEAPADPAQTNTAPAPEAPTSDPETPERPADPEGPTVVFLGNSLSAGYGLDPELAFPALVQQKIDSLGWNFRVVNAGISGETTAGGLSRIDWLLRQRVDVLVLELGGNDGLRGINLDVTEQNLQQIIDRTRAANPDAEIVLAGMQVPPNLGHTYTTRFRTLFPDLAETNGIHLIPFLLEGVGGIPRLNQGDGIHPTAEGHRIVADTVWETLRPVLEELRTG